MSSQKETYELLTAVMAAKKGLLESLAAVACTAVCPPIKDRPWIVDPIERALSAMKRVRFQADEAPNETFHHPGVIVVPEENEKEIEVLVSRVNMAKDAFARAISEIHAGQKDFNESKIMLALVSYHRDQKLPDTIPLIGTPDRLKLRQITRHLRFFPGVETVRITKETKTNVRTIDHQVYVDQLVDRGFLALAEKIASYKQGELKKVSPPTIRWRVGIKTPENPEIKATFATPLIVTPTAGEKSLKIKGITNDGIDIKPPRKRRSDQKQLKLVVEEYSLYTYE